MPGVSQIVAARFRLPRGQDGFWSIMRALDRDQGEFTLAQIEGETCAPRPAIQHYLARLKKGGFVKVVRTEPFGGLRAHVYRLAKRPAAAPRLRADGTELPPPAQQRMWCAMRTLRQFDARELSFAAAMPGAPVPRKTAQRYINQLAVYLAAVGRGQYRLKPSMNTGPLPPSILKIEAVWDRNLKKLIGPDVHDAAEVA